MRLPELGLIRLDMGRYGIGHASEGGGEHLKNRPTALTIAVGPSGYGLRSSTESVARRRMTSGSWQEQAAGMKKSPIMTSPVTAALSMPTENDGSLTEATPQNTEKMATNTSDAAIHGSRSGERVRATTDPHHTQPAATQNSTAVGGSSTGGAHRATSPRGSCCPVR